MWVFVSVFPAGCSAGDICDGVIIARRGMAHSLGTSRVIVGRRNHRRTDVPGSGACAAYGAVIRLP